jgi:Endonuclease-reverse transcriptase
MGDFNYGDIDWTNPYSMSVTVASKEFIDCLDDCFFTQHVKEPTRITSNGSSILDLVITNDPDMVKKVEIIGNLEGSDHQMLEWITSINLQQCEYQGTTKDYSRANYDGIKDRMRHIDWENILNCEVEQC